MDILSKQVQELLAKHPDEVRRAMSFFARNPTATEFSFSDKNGDVVTIKPCHVQQ